LQSRPNHINIIRQKAALAHRSPKDMPVDKPLDQYKTTCRHGAADTYRALAFAQVDELIDYIKAHPNKPI